MEIKLDDNTYLFANDFWCRKTEVVRGYHKTHYCLTFKGSMVR